MKIIATVIRHFRRKKLIQLECKIAGLSAKLKRTEQLAKQSTSPIPDNEAIEITAELWEKKRMLQLLSEEITTVTDHQLNLKP